MKTKILSLLLLSATALGFTACSDDDPDTSYTVIEPGVTEKNDLDLWLEANYNKPYNIDFKYRYEDIEGDFNYYLVPARYDDAVTMAHLIKHLCVETYNEVAGVDFTRQYFPKMFYLVGEWEWNNNNTFILGTAEGGLPADLPSERGHSQPLLHQDHPPRVHPHPQPDQDNPLRFPDHHRLRLCIGHVERDPELAAETHGCSRPARTVRLS